MVLCDGPVQCNVIMYRVAAVKRLVPPVQYVWRIVRAGGCVVVIVYMCVCYVQSPSCTAIERSKVICSFVAINYTLHNVGSTSS